MVKIRMRLSRIRPLQQRRHRALPAPRVPRDRVLQRLVKARRVRQRTGVSPRELHVAEVVDRHAGDDEEDVFVAEGGERLAELVVLEGVFSFEEGDLHDGDA